MHNPILDPFIFAERTIIIYGDVYCEMLELCSEILPQLVEAVKGLLFFQQGSLYFSFTKPHYSHWLHATINFWFPNRWIGRAGPIAWPPRNPDMTPLLFGGLFKSIVYLEKIYSNNHFPERIVTEVGSVTPNMLARTRMNLIFFFNVCISKNGIQIGWYVAIDCA